MTAKTAHEIRILDNSIERVINTTLRILDKVEKVASASPSLAEDISTNQQDWEELQQTVRELWEAERERILRGRLATASK